MDDKKITMDSIDWTRNGLVLGVENPDGSWMKLNPHDLALLSKALRSMLVVGHEEYLPSAASQSERLATLARWAEVALKQVANKEGV